METTYKTLSSASLKDTKIPDLSEQNFIPVFSDGLRIDSMVDFDLYLKPKGGETHVLFRNKNLKFTTANAQRLKEQGGRIYIHLGDREKYLNYVEEHLPEILADDTVSATKKSALLYSSASNMVEQIFEKPTAGSNIRRASSMVNNIVHSVIDNREAFKNLFAIASRDYYVYTHSVNVCTYSLVIAESMGITDGKTLSELGIGAIVHDIGKAKISDGIVGKPGPLSKKEWEEMKLHPEYGGEILRQSSRISPASIDIVLAHHEKVNGSGYPFGLRKDKISLPARITCVADIFDALTTNRPYRKAMSSFQALMLMEREMREQIDRTAYEHFVLLLKE